MQMQKQIPAIILPPISGTRRPTLSRNNTQATWPRIPSTLLMLLIKSASFVKPTDE